MNYKLLSVVILFFLCSALSAAPPAPGKKGYVMPCGVSGVTHAQVMRAKRAIQPSAVHKEYSVLVIRVEFQEDSDSTTSGNGIFLSTTTVDSVQGFMTRMNNYYSENTYGLITISATVTTGGSGTNGQYKMPREMREYGYNYTGGDYNIYLNNTYRRLLEDAIRKAEEHYTFADYDHYMIYHAGAGEETDLWNPPKRENDIWSAYVEFSNGIIANGNNVEPITNATFVPEYENWGFDAFGVICHEYGHQLGLPDLYRTDTGESSVGKWSLMDYGIYLGDPPGENPSHLDAWCKLQLEVISPQTMSSDADTMSFSLQPAETAVSGLGSKSNAFLRLPILTADNPQSEYLLLEYRLRGVEYYDAYIPASGLLIWRVDESVGSFELNNVNNNPARRRLDLIEQDGIDNSVDYGNAANVFADGDRFNDVLYPQAKAYNGTASGVGIFNIAGRGDTAMSFTVSRILAADNVDFVKINNYPNPAVGGNTTFVFRTTKPPSKMEFDIYNIAGEKVRSVNTTEIIMDPGSANYDWVFKYQWDGRNGSGSKVAPGVYLYRVKMDNQIKTGKLAVIR